MADKSVLLIGILIKLVAVKGVNSTSFCFLYQYYYALVITQCLVQPINGEMVL